jgi:hypothetical protein
MTGHVCSRHAAMAPSSRSARRARTCTLHPIRCSSTSTPASVYAVPAAVIVHRRSTGGFLRYVADCIESPATALGDM